MLFIGEVAQPRPIAVHVFVRTPMMFTKPPAQKDAVQISPVRKERYDIWTSSKKDFLYISLLTQMNENPNDVKTKSGKQKSKKSRTTISVLTLLQPD